MADLSSSEEESIEKRSSRPKRKSILPKRLKNSFIMDGNLKEKQHQHDSSGSDYKQSSEDDEIDDRNATRAPSDLSSGDENEPKKLSYTEMMREVVKETQQQFDKEKEKEKLKQSQQQSKSSTVDCENCPNQLEEKSVDNSVIADTEEKNSGVEQQSIEDCEKLEKQKGKPTTQKEAEKQQSQDEETAETNPQKQGNKRKRGKDQVQENQNAIHEDSGTKLGNSKKIKGKENKHKKKKNDKSSKSSSISVLSNVSARFNQGAAPEGPCISNHLEETLSQNLIHEESLQRHSTAIPGHQVTNNSFFNPEMSEIEPFDTVESAMELSSQRVQIIQNQKKIIQYLQNLNRKDDQILQNQKKLTEMIEGLTEKHGTLEAEQTKIRKFMKKMTKTPKRSSKPNYLPFNNEENILNFQNCSDDDYDNLTSYLQTIGGRDLKSGVDACFKEMFDDSAICQLTYKDKKENKVVVKPGLRNNKAVLALKEAVSSCPDYDPPTEELFKVAFGASLKACKERVRNKLAAIEKARRRAEKVERKRLRREARLRAEQEQQ